eukprot:15042298-Alexandrium_andersonii.AAC.1
MVEVFSARSFLHPPPFEGLGEPLAAAGEGAGMRIGMPDGLDWNCALLGAPCRSTPGARSVS